MGIRRGSISTPIISDGLLLNMDAANRASYVEFADTSYNTIKTPNLAQSGSLINISGNLGAPKAWDFDGVDDRITITPGISNLSTFTTSFFVKTSTMDGTQNIILDQNGASLRVQISGNKFGIHMGYGIGWLFTADKGATTLSSDTWYQTVWTWDGSISSIYLNGVLDGSFAHTLTTHTTTGTGELNLGQYNYNDGNNWNGDIANCQIYNRSLTATEVLHNYNALKGRFGL